jgi:hypothetical protein
VIEDRGGGTFDVLRGTRTIAFDLSRSAAETLVNQKKSADDKVFLKEGDGYLTPLVLSTSRRKRKKG